MTRSSPLRSGRRHPPLALDHVRGVTVPRRKRRLGDVHDLHLFVLRINLANSLCVEPMRLSRGASGPNESPHRCKEKNGQGRIFHRRCGRRGGRPTSHRSQSHKATPLRLQDPTPGGSTTSDVNDAAWDSAGLACHQAWRATSRLGVLSSRCARGRAGGTHPSLGQGRRTLTSRRPQAADSSEPPTSRTKKRSIDMSRRRLRDISRRTC